MEIKSERIEVIKNQELKELLIELKEVDTEIVKMVESSEEAAKAFESKQMIRQKIVDKMKPIVNAEFVGKLGEFELLANITLPEVHDDDSVEVKIVDEVEKFIEGKRKAKEVKFEEPIGDVSQETVAE